MNRKAILIIVFIFCYFFVHSQSYPFKNYNSTNGLASATVYTCFQDSKGYMWFGTETGALKFDGKNFRLYTIDEGLSDNEIFTIDEDSQGRLWFLTFSGTPSCMKNDTLYNPSTMAMLKLLKSEKSLSMFMEDEQHNVWIGSTGIDLFKISGNKVKRYEIDQGIKKAAVSFINNDHEIWFCTYDGFYKEVDGQLEYIPTQYVSISSRAVTNDRDGSVLFIAEEGIVRMNGTKQELIVPKSRLPVSLKLISGLSIDVNGDMWFLTLGDGVYFYKKKNNTYTFEEKLLPDKIVSSFICDHEGNYWFTTIGNGVYMLPSDYLNYRSYTSAEGLANNYVYSVCKDNKGKLWLGMNNGIVHMIDHHEVRTFDINFDKSYYLRAVDIAKDPEDNIWVATDKSVALFQAPDHSPRSVQSQNPKSSLFPKNIDISDEGEVSFTMAMGVVKIVKKAEGQYDLIMPEYFESKRTYTHHFDRKGRLWVATIEGLNCYDHNRVIKYGYENELLRKRITEIRGWNDSVLVLSTYGYGIIFFKEGKIIKHLKEADGLAGNICKKIFIDWKKNVWVATNKGVSRIAYDKGRFRMEKFTIYDGLLSDDANDIYVDTSGIYVATTGGLSIITGSHKMPVIKAPPVWISRVMNNNKDISHTPGVRLSYANTRILIDYIALSYSDPLQLIYEYRLNDANWETTRNTSVEFSSLKPGKYHFELKARKENGEWSKPQTFDFTIVPPVWQNLYFLIPLFTLIGAFSIFMIRYSINRARLIQTEKLKIQNKMTQLEQKALQAMMNPHFIFNVMNSIQNYMNSHDQLAVNQYLSSFAKLIRKNMDIATESYISLHEEIDYLNLYLSLEKLRFEDQLIYSITTDEQLDPDEIILPSMILQPFIENAIWHGIMPLEKAGRIDIKFTHSGDEMLIEIKDNGIGIKNSIAAKANEVKDHVSRGIGLVLERIMLINQSNDFKIHVDIQQDDLDSGTMVVIRMPLQLQFENLKV